MPNLPTKAYAPSWLQGLNCLQDSFCLLHNSLSSCCLSPDVFPIQEDIHLVARSFYRTVQNKNMPNLMSFAVNDTCDAAWNIVVFFPGSTQSKEKTVTLDQAKQIIKEAQELGVSMINFVGGEPLLREDLPKL